jgi:hypothetical protein
MGIILASWDAQGANTQRDVVVMREFCWFVKVKVTLLGADCFDILRAGATSVNY